MPKANHTTRKPWTAWSPAEIVELRRLYPTTSTNDLADYFCRSPVNICMKARRLGIVRADDFEGARRGRKVEETREDQSDFTEFREVWNRSRALRFKNRAWKRQTPELPAFAVRVI